MRTQAMQDEWTAPRCIPIGLYYSSDSAEVKGSIIYAAMEELIDNYVEIPGSYGLVYSVKNLIREVNEVFNDEDAETKQGLAKTLNRHHFFEESGNRVTFKSAKNQLAVEKHTPRKRDPWAEPKPRGDPPLCWYWTQGKCTKQPCPFRHYLNDQEQLLGVGNIQKDDAELCWFWQQGYCGKGDECTFRHHFKATEAKEAAEYQLKQLQQLQAANAGQNAADGSAQAIAQAQYAALMAQQAQGGS